MKTKKKNKAIHVCEFCTRKEPSERHRKEKHMIIQPRPLAVSGSSRGKKCGKEKEKERRKREKEREREKKVHAIARTQAQGYKHYHAGVWVCVCVCVCV